eukprot:UN27001
MNENIAYTPNFDEFNQPNHKKKNKTSIPKQHQKYNNHQPPQSSMAFTRTPYSRNRGQPTSHNHVNSHHDTSQRNHRQAYGQPNDPDSNFPSTATHYFNPFDSFVNEAKKITTKRSTNPDEESEDEYYFNPLASSDKPPYHHNIPVHNNQPRHQHDYQSHTELERNQTYTCHDCHRTFMQWAKCE